jgi:hypothetical protein
MKIITTTCLCVVAFISSAQKNDTREAILHQLKCTHNNRGWFVPLNEAVHGLTAEQAAQKSADNHSVGQLTHHILFWTERNLLLFKTGSSDKFNGNNEETFDKFDQQQWDSLVVQVDRVFTELEEWITKASDDEIQKYKERLSNIPIHNAYHIGQIISARKAQGSWKR